MAKFPREKNSYGLIHADFSDGNFCINYQNGDIIVFDFDDSAYCWFMYDLANVWRGGVGWIARETDKKKRRNFMNKYFDTLLNGYTSEHTLSETWLKRLTIFIKLTEMEAFLDELRYRSIEEEDEDDGAIAYTQKCIEEDIPFLGFFDDIYSPESPFMISN